MTNTNLYTLLIILLFSVVTLTSCKETQGIDEYADWQGRNETYLDFVAQEALANQGQEVGQWRIIKSYVLSPDLGNITTERSNYVYARINKVGKGATTLYGDSISIYYRETLINGTLFDNSPAFVPKNALSTDTIFAGKPNDAYGDIYQHVVYFPDFNILTPSKYKIQQPNLTVGWITALQEMKEGDYWTVYIPAALNYGSSDYSTIPGNSLLIFDLYLEKRFLK